MRVAATPQISASGRRPNENWVRQKKTMQKITYPPPADALYVLFFCKSARNANDPPDQAGRGASQAIGHFTMCKVLRRNAARLHSDRKSAREGSTAQSPGFIGRKIGKRRKGGIFEKGKDQFGGGNCEAVHGGNIATPQAGRGLQAVWGISQLGQGEREKMINPARVKAAKKQVFPEAWQKWLLKVFVL